MPQLFEDQNIVAPEQSGIGLAPGENVPGVGLVNDSGPSDPLRMAVDQATAPTQAPRQSSRDAVRERFQGLSTGQKIFAALGEFGAGVQGKPSPMRGQIEDERKDRTLKVAEDKEKLTTFVDGMKALSTIPAGKEREAVAEKMAPHMGDMGEAFLTLSKQPDYSAKLLAQAQDSPTLTRSLQTIGPSATLHLMGQEAFNKTVNAEIDARRLPIVQQHVRTLLAAAPHLDPAVAADIKKRGYATHGDIVALNDLAAKDLPGAAMKPTDLAILNQHAEGVYAGVTGTLGPAGAQKALLGQIEKNQPTSFMREAEALHGKDTPEYFGAIRKHLDRMDSPTAVMLQAGQKSTPESRAATAGMVAQGMPLSQAVPGYGAASTQERRDARDDAIKLIQKQHPEMGIEQAGAELANRSIDFVAGKRSVTQLNTMLGATRQAVDQLDFNVKKVTEQMDKLPSSDLSPVINAIARGASKWSGDPAYSSLFYYMHAAGMESARILQGGQASIAQLHQGAADEAKKWADANFTTPKAWKEGVAPAMQQEGAERIKTYERAIAKQRPGGGTEAPQTKEEYTTKFGKPPPSIGNKDGFEKLNKGDGYIDSRDGQYKIKG